MKIKEVNYYGLKHDEVAKKFSGDLTYIRTFQIRGNTWAVYKAANPDRENGHKDYMMLGCDPVTDKWYVSGCTPEEMEEERRQHAVLCTGCDTILYSINRHHFHSCGCKLSTFVDGGKDYLRRGGSDLSAIVSGMLDLITGEFTTDNVTGPRKTKDQLDIKPKVRQTKSTKTRKGKKK